MAVVRRDRPISPPHPTHAKRVCLCVINAHLVQCPVSHKHWSRISSRICPSSKDKRQGGAETSVWQAQTCRRQPTHCMTRSLIGPASRPISDKLGLRKIPPRTRAVCTLEGKALHICWERAVIHWTCRAVCIYNADDQTGERIETVLLFNVIE